MVFMYYGMIHSKLYKIHSFYYTSMIILQFKEIRKWLMIIPHIIKIAQNIRLASRGFIIQNINKYGFHRIMTYNISWYEFANGLRLNIDYKGFIFSVDVKCESLPFKKPDFLNIFSLASDIWILRLWMITFYAHQIRAMWSLISFFFKQFVSFCCVYRTFSWLVSIRVYLNWLYVCAVKKHQTNNYATRLP